MAAALLFGLYHHYFVINPDHVHVLPDGMWQLPFQVSTIGVALTDGLGMVVSAWYWRLSSQKINSER